MRHKKLAEDFPYVMPPKLLNWLNYRVRITLHDGRQLVGTFLAFDRHMNLVVSDCEEYRKIKDKSGSGEEKEFKRTLGLLLLRGESIVSMTAECPPVASSKKVGDGGPQSRPGMAMPVGRGAGMVPPAMGFPPMTRGSGMPPGMMPPGMMPPPPPPGGFR